MSDFIATAISIACGTRCPEKVAGCPCCDAWAQYDALIAGGGRRRGQKFAIDHDGFAGQIIGHYRTLEGKPGIVGQLDGASVVHVYGEKWL